MNRIVQTDLKKLANLLLPVRLRHGMMTAVLDVMMHPLSYIKRNLSEYADTKEAELKITGQTCKLEKMLNDNFDDGLRRIRVVDSSLVDLPAVYVFPRGDENNVLHVHSRDDDNPVFLQLRGSMASIATDFYVELPTALRHLRKDARLAALVNKYKLASKRWLTRINNKL